MFLREGERKFFVRGVSYGPFRPGPTGEPFPEKSAMERDFALLRELGANTLRIYHVPPQSICQLAAEFGLRLLVGVPWPQHLRFLDTREARDDIRRRVREAAEKLRGVPNLLGILIGNEIPPEVVRWYGPARVEAFLGDLVDEVRQANPEALVSYANFPMTEYLDLPGLDFVSFNVYLHRDQDLRRYLSRLQNLADFRPVVLSEFGIDSIREGEDHQAQIMEQTVTAAADLGLAGAIAFSFTDEWHTGGHDIEDWSFGLVTRDRTPKPAFAAVQRVFKSDLPRLPEQAPRVSVVICAYNAERTMKECLDSLRLIRYPNYEVIVVDDGSTDTTRAISEQYPEFRLISHENRGLSVARNEGILAATGEIVAFTDSDCAVDPDWLNFLVQRLLSESFAAVGGPNLPPAEDHWVPEVVARSPGGPTHVLLSDHEAEHIPGCNMAFWRERLLEVGLFDPIYRAAGDDVDICWRLQNAGHKIGFAAAALVWHRRRATVRAYLNQQKGYGRAESLLYFKHPYRFNFLGHSRWLGRIYSDLGTGILGRRPVIYSGALGSGLFQTLYEAPSSMLRHLPATLEWNAAALGLASIGAFSMWFGFPLPTLLLAGVALFVLSIAQAVWTALEVDVKGVPVSAWRARTLIAALNYLGPLLRAIERHRTHIRGVSSVERIRFPKLRQRPVWDWRAVRFVLSYWNETSIEKEHCISAVIDFLRPRKYPIIIDDGWQPWDFSVHRGVWARAPVKVLIQNHGAEKRQIDIGVAVRPTTLSSGVLLLLATGAVLAVTAGAWEVGATLSAALLGFSGFLVAQARRLGRTLYHAIEFSFHALPVVPLGPALPNGNGNGHGKGQARPVATPAAA
jgi:glycosyltransferase involved in cell wall biosynthesis